MSNWHAKATGAYADTSNEAIDNAKSIYEVLGGLGWTVNAVCGLLGNISHEGGMNPWRWQSDRVPSKNESPWRNKGYGFTQFTPGGKYINDPFAINSTGYAPNFSDKTGLPSDGYAQMIFVDAKADYYPTAKYQMSYADFKISESDPETLASVWLYNYERPSAENARKTEPSRRSSALYWWGVLNGEPVPPPTPRPPLGLNIPIWLLFKLGRCI